MRQIFHHEIGGYSSLPKNKLTLDFAVYLLEGRNEGEHSPTWQFNRYPICRENVMRNLDYIQSRLHSLCISPWRNLLCAPRNLSTFTISRRRTDAVQNLDGFDMPSAPRWIANLSSLLCKMVPKLPCSARVPVRIELVSKPNQHCFLRWLHLQRSIRLPLQTRNFLPISWTWPINCMLPMSLEEIPNWSGYVYCRTAFSWWDCGTTYH
jgi:hypothetical protein